MSINNINEVLKEEIKRVSVGKEEYKYLNEISRLTIKEIEKRLKKLKINASVFIGGSLAKETVVKKEKHDIDLFLRFDKKYPEPQINRFMRKIFFLFKVPGFKAKVKKIHGSRDYVQIIFKKHGVMIEVVPSIKIANPEEARNITDLSYFHIKYVNDKIKKHKKLSDEIILAKAFCHAQKCYGAESYINGFSGYALELLIINCGSFEKFLNAVADSSGKIVFDSANHYKNVSEVLNVLNPAKRQSPIILIDPTSKDRNAAASLSQETFDKFKDACRRFLNNPSIEHFEHKKVSIDKMRNYAMEIEGAFAVFHVETNKQEGDIAGTKLLKFHSFLGKELEKNFDIIEQHFEYDYGKDSYNYFIIKRKKEIVIYGPALNYKEGVENFKKTHRIWYIQDGKICAAKSPEITVKQFLKEFNRRNKTQMKQMGITKVELA
ncbi:nucleotidyltransferase domain-containing protein [Candidatus Pacearchaeota archaeon]|nr:nucleotidyltransferase domain-containing protein [Candidatus Pacearchaeota archaeon]